MAEDIPQGINDLPDPSTFAAPAGSGKKRRTKKELEEPGGLSMNSLMDIMTIILVFLLKSYSTDPVQLKQAPDLKPPFSTAQLKPSESTVVTVTLNNIVVDDKPVAKLEEGMVAKNDLGGDFLVDPLLNELQDRVDHQKRVNAASNAGKEFEGIVTIIADRNVPFKLLSQVMYTAGQAEFSKFKFMVVKGGA